MLIVKADFFALQSEGITSFTALAVVTCVGCLIYRDPRSDKRTHELFLEMLHLLSHHAVCAGKSSASSARRTCPFYWCLPTMKIASRKAKRRASWKRASASCCLTALALKISSFRGSRRDVSQLGKPVQQTIVSPEQECIPHIVNNFCHLLTTYELGMPCVAAHLVIPLTERIQSASARADSWTHQGMSFHMHERNPNPTSAEYVTGGNPWNADGSWSCTSSACSHHIGLPRLQSPWLAINASDSTAGPLGLNVCTPVSVSIPVTPDALANLPPLARGKPKGHQAKMYACSTVVSCELLDERGIHVLISPMS